MSSIPSSRLQSTSPVKPTSTLSSLPATAGPSSSRLEPFVDRDDDLPDDIDMGDENDENLPPANDPADYSGEGEEGDDAEEGESDDDEDEEEVEGDVEGEGDEDGEEDEDDESDEEDDDEDDARSEDLEGDGDVTFIREGSGPLAGPSGELRVKTEPGEAGEASGQGETAGVGTEGETVNTLVPKKKRVIRRSPSAERRPPPPPLDTIRLSHTLPPVGTTLEWNVLKSATEAGLSMRRWYRDDDEEDLDPSPARGPAPPNGVGKSPVRNGTTGPGPSGLPLLPEGDDAEALAEIARKIDERWGGNTQPVKKAAAKRKVIELYDDTDPFIDDSEIQQDAPTHMAQTEKEGFFVHKGVVPLKKAVPKPSRSRPSQARKNPRVSQLGPSKPPQQRKTLAHIVSAKEKSRALNGSAGSPIKIDSDDESNAGPSSPYLRTPSPDLAEDLVPLPVDRSLFASAPKDPSLLPPWLEFPKEIRRQLHGLRDRSLNHSWDLKAKGKFPDEIRPYLKDCGRAAFHHGMFELGEDDEARYFHALPSVLPYNTFTLTKLSTKLCHDEYQQFLDRCEVVGLRALREQINNGRDEVEKKYNDSVQQYKEAKRKWDEEHPQEGTNGSGAVAGTSTGLPNGSGLPIDLSGDAPDDEENPRPTQIDGEPKEPQKKFPFTTDMTYYFGQLLANTQQMVELNRKAGEWRIPNARTGRDYTELNMRAALYKKVAELFPPGYMNPTTLSREMSKIARSKKKSVKKVEAAQVE